MQARGNRTLMANCRLRNTFIPFRYGICRFYMINIFCVEAIHYVRWRTTRCAQLKQIAYSVLKERLRTYVLHR